MKKHIRGIILFHCSQIPSAKVCDYFLDALEKGKYGWRWVCPNGMTCHYKHCLPTGYVYRKKEEVRQG